MPTEKRAVVSQRKRGHPVSRYMRLRQPWARQKAARRKHTQAEDHLPHPGKHHCDPHKAHQHKRHQPAHAYDAETAPRMRIISSARPVCMRRVRAYISIPIKAADTAAVVIQILNTQLYGSPRGTYTACIHACNASAPVRPASPGHSPETPSYAPPAADAADVAQCFIQVVHCSHFVWQSKTIQIVVNAKSPWNSSSSR